MSKRQNQERIPCGNIDDNDTVKPLQNTHLTFKKITTETKVA